MSNVCLPGLQGFPVQVSGWNNLTDKSQLIMPNDIYLQFSPSETPMKYFSNSGGAFSINGTNSFFISGNQYDVFTVRLTKPDQEGLQSFSGNAVAEFTIWGQKKSAESEFAALVIPIFTKPIESRTGAALLRAINGESARLIDCVPDQQTEIVRYKTCVETDSKTTSMIFIDVAYWSTGSFVRQTEFSKIIPGLAKPGFPLRREFKLLTSYTQLNDADLTKSDRKYEVIPYASLPYKKSVSLSATSKEFQNAFRIIKDFTKEKEDSEPKYIPINTETDIKDGMLMVDISTGKRLSAEDIEETQKKMQEQSANKEEVQIQVQNINYGLVLFLKIVGFIIGVSLLVVILRFFQKFVSSPAPSSVQLPIETLSQP
jgi:hypothetical protein